VLKVGKKEIEEYIGDLLDRRSASTAATRYRGLQQLHRWALNEDLIDHSPMTGMRPPAIPEAPVPVVSETDLRALLRASEGKGLAERRDTALWRLMLEPGGMRLGEVASLTLESVDLDNDQVIVHGKGRRVRSIPFGARTGTALTRYLRVRREHKHANSPALWLGRYGPMTDSGITQALRRRCAQAGITQLHPHQLRHTSADRWLAESGGDETSAMRLFGWRSREMLQRYAASNADARAAAAARRLSLGDRL
jgi:site-specific recombinase XerD